MFKCASGRMGSVWPNLMFVQQRRMSRWLRVGPSYWESISPLITLFWRPGACPDSPRRLHLTRPLLPSIILLSWTNQPHDVALVSSDQIILVLRNSSILKASSVVEPHSSLPFVFHLTLTCVRVADRAEADQKRKAVISNFNFPASEERACISFQCAL
jgi:hypothetical protein